MSELTDIMDELLANLVREVDPGETFCARTLLPGAAVFAEYLATENQCTGMLWVRLASANLTANFPNADVRAGQCNYSLATPLEVGVLRQAPKIQVTMNRPLMLPTNAQQTEATHLQIEDMEAMRRAIFRTVRGYDDYLLGSYTPVGPEEGIFGGSWTVTVGVD